MPSISEYGTPQSNNAKALCHIIHVHIVHTIAPEALHVTGGEWSTGPSVASLLKHIQQVKRKVPSASPYPPARVVLRALHQSVTVSPSVLSSVYS